MNYNIVVRLKGIKGIPNWVFIKKSINTKFIRVYFVKDINTNKFNIEKVVDINGNNIEFTPYTTVIKNAPSKFMRLGTTELLTNEEYDLISTNFPETIKN